MNLRSYLWLACMTALVACGSSKTNATTDPTMMTDAAMGSMDDAGTDDAPDPYAGLQVVTITTDSFDVPPGQEMYRCQNFANPFDGLNVDIARFEVTMPAGSHHMIMFFE